MSTIPGTGYQIRGDNFVAPDGNSLTKEQFLKKVESKEIGLNAVSLRFLDNQFGPDVAKSLYKAAGVQTSPGDLLGKVSDSGGKVMTDVFSMLEILHKLSQDMRKSVQEGRQEEFKAQMTTAQKSNDENLKAANIRMWSGIVTGALTMASGGIMAGGGIKGTETAMKTTEGVSKSVDGASKLIGAAIEHAAAEVDHEAKDHELDSRRMEEMAQGSRDLLDSVREMDAKLRDALRDIHNSENEANKAPMRM